MKLKNFNDFKRKRGKIKIRRFSKNGGYKWVPFYKKTGRGIGTEIIIK